MKFFPMRCIVKSAGSASRWQMVAVFLLVATFLVPFSVYLARQEVLLVVDNKTYQVNTLSFDVAGALHEAGVIVNEGDMLSHRLSEPVSRGMVIELRRAFPVTVLADGDEQIVRVIEATVADALEMAGVRLGEMDVVVPEMEHILRPGDAIRVSRVYRRLVTQQTEIPYREIRRGNHTMDKGETRVVAQGVSGLREDTVEIIFKDGAEIAAHVLDSRILKPKQDRVIEYGENTLLSRGGRTLEFMRVVQVLATGYCPGTEASGCPVDELGQSKCTGRYNDGFTYTGRQAIAGSGLENDPHLVAVDPRFIPLGSRLYIDGFGFAVAADTGSAIKGNRIDILFDSHDKAWSFGRRPLRVYLLP